MRTSIKAAVIAVSCILPMASGAQASVASLPANVIFADSFEGDTPANWRVYDRTGDNGDFVTVDGAGIEIQTAGTLGFTPYDGNNYVELDSDNGNGGVLNASTNTTMAALVGFEEGKSYEVGFAYRPRTSNGGDDNGIALSVGNLDDRAFTARDMLLSIAETRKQRNDWVYLTVMFTAQADDNAIAFSAFGLENTLGGLIDAVRVVETPLPAAALLFATGLAGVSTLRRRKAANAA